MSYVWLEIPPLRLQIWEEVCVHGSVYLCVAVKVNIQMSLSVWGQSFPQAFICILFVWENDANKRDAGV